MVFLPTKPVNENQIKAAINIRLITAVWLSGICKQSLTCPCSTNAEKVSTLSLLKASNH